MLSIIKFTRTNHLIRIANFSNLLSIVIPNENDVMLTDKWDETLLFIIDDFIVEFAVRCRRVLTGVVGIVKAALKMTGPEFTKPRIAAVNRARSFHHVDVLFGAAHFARTGPQRFKVIVKS